MNKENILEIKNLHVQVGDKEIIKGINLEIKEGEVHALMGPNGSGKTSLSFALMGHPNYKITEGEILLNGKDITKLKVDERARLGLFLGFQYPSEVSGVSIAQFLRQAHGITNKKKLSFTEFNTIIREKMSQLNMDTKFVGRYLNEGFSGGEKKRNEILQMSILKPQIAILDEPDSGTDVDALKLISLGINEILKENKTGILLITHYNRILSYVKPDYVHIIQEGKIIMSGDFNLAHEIENKGYETIRGEKWKLKQAF